MGMWPTLQTSRIVILFQASNNVVFIISGAIFFIAPAVHKQ